MDSVQRCGRGLKEERWEARPRGTSHRGDAPGCEQPMKGKTGTGIREGTVRYALIGVMLSLGTSVASAGDL